jgi:hypothetical protein
VLLRHRGDVDHRARSPFDHAGQDPAEEKAPSVQVDRENPPPVLVGVLHIGLRHEDTGSVDQDVGGPIVSTVVVTAPSTSAATLTSPVIVCTAGRCWASCGELILGLLQRGPVQVDDGDPRALGGEPVGRGCLMPEAPR